MISAGLIQLWKRRQQYKIKDYKRFNEKISPEVLTFEHLSNGFLFCSISLAISAFAFILEMIIKQYKILKQNLAEVKTFIRQNVTRI